MLPPSTHAPCKPSLKQRSAPTKRCWTACTPLSPETCTRSSTWAPRPMFFSNFYSNFWLIFGSSSLAATSSCRRDSNQNVPVMLVYRWWSALKWMERVLVEGWFSCFQAMFVWKFTKKILRRRAKYIRFSNFMRFRIRNCRIFQKIIFQKLFQKNRKSY